MRGDDGCMRTRGRNPEMIREVIRREEVSGGLAMDNARGRRARGLVITVLWSSNGDIKTSDL